MTNLYDNLCVIRTAIVNSIGEMTLTGRVVNYSEVLSGVSAELSVDTDFMEELSAMSENELFDLGFQYLSNESFLMMLPLWLYPFVPINTLLFDTEGNSFIVGEDQFQVYAGNWVNAGILLD